MARLHVGLRSFTWLAFTIAAAGGLLLAVAPGCNGPTRAPSLRAGTKAEPRPAAAQPDAGSAPAPAPSPPMDRRASAHAAPEPPPSIEPAASWEDALACRKRHCYPRAKHCFDKCYQYNHLRGPREHEGCDEACRRTYEIPLCEQLCESEPLAFSAAPAGASPCRQKLQSCRLGCAEHPISCEAHCIAAFRSCTHPENSD